MIRTHVTRLKCIRLGPLKDALLTELQCHGFLSGCLVTFQEVQLPKSISFLTECANVGDNFGETASLLLSYQIVPEERKTSGMNWELKSSNGDWLLVLVPNVIRAWHVAKDTTFHEACCDVRLL